MPSEIKNKYFTLDSSVIVSYILKDELNSSKAEEILNNIAQRNYKIIVPLTVLVEIVSAVKRRTGSSELSSKILEKFCQAPNFLFVEITLQNIIKASQIAIKYGLRGMDSVIVQISEEYKTELITFDREIEEKYLSKIKKK